MSAAFRRAASMRVGDARLRNKLGATLPNGVESNDVLHAYRVAFDLFSRYKHAWLNVENVFGNRGERKKVVWYYLRVLFATASVDEDGRTRRITSMDGMGHVWLHLRNALLALYRSELVLHAEERKLDAFRPHFVLASLFCDRELEFPTLARARSVLQLESVAQRKRMLETAKEPLPTRNIGDNRWACRGIVAILRREKFQEVIDHLKNGISAKSLGTSYLKKVPQRRRIESERSRLKDLKPSRLFCASRN